MEWTFFDNGVSRTSAHALLSFKTRARDARWGARSPAPRAARDRSRSDAACIYNYVYTNNDAQPLSLPTATPERMAHRMTRPQIFIVLWSTNSETYLSHSRAILEDDS